MAGARELNYSTSRLYAENRQAPSNFFVDEDPNEIAFDDYTRRKEANIGHHKPRKVFSRRRGVVDQANQYRDTRLSTEVDANLWESLRYDTKRHLEMSDTSVRGLIRLQKENVDKLIDALSELHDLHLELSRMPALSNDSPVARQQQRLARSRILVQMLCAKARQNEAIDMMKGINAILEIRMKDKEVMEPRRAQRSVLQGSPSEMSRGLKGTAVGDTSLKKMLRMVDSKLREIRNAFREQSELIQDYINKGCVDFPPEQMLVLIGELFAYTDHILDIPDKQIDYGIRCLSDSHTEQRDTPSSRHHLPFSTGTLKTREFQTAAMGTSIPERTVNSFATGTLDPRSPPQAGNVDSQFESRQEGREDESGKRKSRGNEADSEKKREGGKEAGSEMRQEGGEEAESEKRKEGREEAESEKPKEGGEDDESEKQHEGGEETESEKQHEGGEETESERQHEGEEEA